MQFIDSITVGTAVASVTFTDIPQDGDTLILKMSIAVTDTNFLPWAELEGYSAWDGAFVRGSRTNESGSNNVAEARFAVNKSVDSVFSNGEAVFLNYTQDTCYLTLRGGEISDATYSDWMLVTGNWTQTGGVTSLTIAAYAGDGNLDVGSTFHLYKLVHS